ncbi:MAG: hypothetical protein ACXWL2_02310, partial [Candidatus Chromulinivorax sp.]
PNAKSPAKLGGHMLFPQAKATTHAIEQIIPFENGYFDLFVKHIADESKKFRPKTQFPLGSTPIENAQLIIDLIKDIKKPIKIEINSIGTKFFDLQHSSNQKFKIYIQESVAHFHPISPNALY